MLTKKLDVLVSFLREATRWLKRAAWVVLVLGIIAVVLWIILIPVAIWQMRPTAVETQPQVEYVINSYKIWNGPILWLFIPFSLSGLYSYTTTDWKIGRIVISGSLTSLNALLAYAYLAQDIGLGSLAARTDLSAGIVGQIHALRTSLIHLNFWTVIVFLGLWINLLASALALPPGHGALRKDDGSIDRRR